MRHGRKGFDFGDFEITKREILASISIIAVMILFGILISSKISEHQMDKNEIYNKAVKIESQEMFQYGMDTNVGNAFIYGDLKAVDTVTYPEIGGEYMSVEKDEEHYTKHTKTVYEYDDDGNVTGSHEEEYWTWDLYDSDNKHCDKVTFLGIEFDYGQIYKPYENYIDTIDGDYHVRYVYYGSKTEYTGTIFTKLDNHTINKTEFYKDMNINDTVDHLQSNVGVIVFWIFWIILIGGMVFGFYYLDNRWLDYQEIFLSWEVINIFHRERTKVENGCDCWGKPEYDDVYEVYYNDEFVCRMSSDPIVLVDKINDVLINYRRMTI